MSCSGVRAAQRAPGFPHAPPERRPLWRRLSGTPPARAGFPLRGGRAAAFGAPTIPESSTWPEAPPARAPRAARTRRLPAHAASRLRRLCQAWASCTLGCCLGVVLFVTDALGLSARARGAYSDLMARAAAVRGRFAQRLASGTQLTRKLSAVALESLGRGVSTTEKVAGLLRRAMSAEGRLDTCGAIRCYQARHTRGRATVARRRPVHKPPGACLCWRAEARVARRVLRRLPTTWCLTTRSRWWAWRSASRTAVRATRRGARSAKTSQHLTRPAVTHSSPPRARPVTRRQSLSRTSSPMASWRAPWRRRRRTCRSGCVPIGAPHAGARACALRGAALPQPPPAA
jgi:hypothetical protein